MDKYCIENKTPVIHTDFDTNFEKHINLKNLILPVDNNIKILDVVINEYYCGLSEDVPIDIEPILIVSNQSCSTIARAIHNTICNLSYQEYSCELIGRGGRVAECFEHTYEFSTVHLAKLQKIPYIYYQPILEILRDRICTDPQRNFFAEEKIYTVEGLLILSGTEKAPIIPAILKNIDTIIRIGNYRNDDVCKILQQRADFYELSFEDKDQTLQAITQASHCNVGDAINTLWWAYRACRAEGRNIINLRDVNTIFLHKRGLG